MKIRIKSLHIHSQNKDTFTKPQCIDIYNEIMDLPQNYYTYNNFFCVHKADISKISFMWNLELDENSRKFVSL